MTKQQFIKEIAKYVQKYAPEFGIKVCSPIIAQACLESAYGTSKKATYHNYFGLKYRKNRVTCNKGYFTDGGSEQNSDGTYTPLPGSTAWYSFESIEKGVLGYFQFINISNYSNLKGVTNPLEYLQNIKNDGYATSINYVQNVYKVIQDWNLTKYDMIEKEEQKMIKIAIDAGHGSETAGKRTPDGYKEHWINVKTAYYCEQLLKQHGISVLRVAWDDTDATDDSDIPLTTRQAIIKAAKCDYSVSMHANAFGNGSSFNSAQGVSTHIHDKIERRGTESEALAKAIQNELIKGTSQKNRGVVHQSLSMCNCQKMGTKGSCLMEIAFMTNEHEAKLLKTEEFCKEQGEDIARGVLKYLGIAIQNSTSNVTPPINNNNSSDSNNFKIGEKVKLIAGATYVNGKKPAPFVYNATLYVRGIVNGSDVIISTLKMGAITGIVNAKDLIKIEINNSNPVTPTFKSYIVKVTTNSLNIRKGPGVLHAKTGVIKDRGKYTIVEEKNGWGKLKSGAGWISLKYTQKV